MDISLWQSRLLRFWIVVLVPSAIVFGGMAYLSHRDATFYQKAASNMLESIEYARENTDYRPLFSPTEMMQMFNERIERRDAAEWLRALYATLSFVSLISPIIFLAIWRAYQWVWYGK